MSSFWDDKFSGKEYIYGTKPNDFVKYYIDNTTNKGSMLFVGEGEGRNALYAALNGWEVTAHDASRVAKDKALKLASGHGISYQYIVSDILDLDTGNKFNAIGLIYMHLPSEIRKSAHQLLTQKLQIGGELFLEVFSKNQINNNSGGPKNIDMLYSLEDLKADFANLEIVSCEEISTSLNEGNHHIGKADIIRMILRKSL